jgi:hypothetical protein
MYAVAGLKNLPFVRLACSLKKLTRLKVSCGSHQNKKLNDSIMNTGPVIASFTFIRFRFICN